MLPVRRAAAWKLDASQIFISAEMRNTSMSGVRIWASEWKGLGQNGKRENIWGISGLCDPASLCVSLDKRRDLLGMRNIKCTSCDIQES